ncbi:TetR/AcrR family transcriptional regulator [Kineococcus glutinatus]|uniref:TetR family transcriptional regulator n=1 Tax=Kineococcus glutinatus TaxID=1070872 RepID=A0ABP8VCN4_9ACTN
MDSVRERCADAAVVLLGEGGARALTHRAADARARVPAGSTSNHFRTRDALLAGALQRIGELEREHLAGLRAPAAVDAAELLVDVLAAAIGFLLGPGRTLARARHAVFLEAAWRPHLREAVLAGTRPFWALLAEALRAAGAAEPERAARRLLAYVDGLVVDQLLRPEEGFDAVAAVRTFLRGALR